MGRGHIAPRTCYQTTGLRTVVPQVARQCTGVDVGNCDHVVCGKKVGFHIHGRGAGVADVRRRQGDDLTGIGRITEDLLIAGHGGIEDDFTDGHAVNTNGDAVKRGAVGEHEKGCSGQGLNHGLERADVCRPSDRLPLAASR